MKKQGKQGWRDIGKWGDDGWAVMDRERLRLRLGLRLRHGERGLGGLGRQRGGWGWFSRRSTRKEVNKRLKATRPLSKSCSLAEKVNSTRPSGQGTKAWRVRKLRVGSRLTVVSTKRAGLKPVAQEEICRTAAPGLAARALVRRVSSEGRRPG